MEHPILFCLICFQDSVFPKTAPTWRRSRSHTEQGWECQLPRERQLHLCLVQLLMAPEKRGQDLWPPGALGNPHNRVACCSLQHKRSWVRDLWVKIKEQMAKESIFTNVESVLCLYAHTLSCTQPTCTPLLMDNEVPHFLWIMSPCCQPRLQPITNNYKYWCSLPCHLPPGECLLSTWNHRKENFAGSYQIRSQGEKWSYIGCQHTDRTTARKILKGGGFL